MPLAWPNTAPGASYDWLEFIAEVDGAEIHYRLNLSWLMSNWQCQYGSCPGVLSTGANTDIACCQVGVDFNSMADFNEVKQAVKQLTAEDCDRINEVRSKGWYTKHIPEGRKMQYPKGTKVVDGACIFANRTGGPAGKPGCALHHLATRTGQKTWHTKPDICWQIPMVMQVAYYEDHTAVEVSGSTAAAWGWKSNEYPAIGYWCTETPDAYNAVWPVFRTWDEVLAYSFGEKIWAPARERLDREFNDWMRRAQKMPGQRANNGGRKLLPLLVMERRDAWIADGSPEAAEALKRSEAYFDSTGLDVA